ncbi:MAG: iron-sulfur cluster assembly scaffold protein [Euryarchaeota archaeon HGW-Euryarchaeota-1]|nr:MAG: iron-sulfur cluster assembly scaffold protein [Euryarchaeota archaeon HGW-Euryarchaeota-1]
MEYNKKILSHFFHPKNMGRIKNPSGYGRAGNPVCGDIMDFYLKIKEEKGNEIIKDVKWETLGCPVALANSSVLSEMVKGKSLKDTEKITQDQIVKKLGGNLPQQKLHCSMLALDALRAAISDYKMKAKPITTKALKR